MQYQHATAAAMLCCAMPAAAQDAAPRPVTISGNVTLATDYRFRGVSQSDEGMAVQGGFTVTHESGTYAGIWGSNLAGWGSFGGANTELDLFGGVKLPLGGGATLDAGLTWYMYPAGADKTDFAEPYVKFGTTLGPVSFLGGVAYAPEQEALGNWSNTPQSKPGDRHDNLYLWSDASIGIPRTALTLKGHVGYSQGNPGLGPNGTSIAATGKYADWLLGADYVLGPVTLGLAYVDTDIGKAKSAYLLPNFARLKNGKSIAGATMVFSVSAAF